MNENELMNEAARELNEINESDVVNVTALVPKELKATGTV